MKNDIQTEVNGMSLFTEVEDKQLQMRNRASILVNIMDNISMGSKKEQVGFTIESLQYWQAIPSGELVGMEEMIHKVIEDRGENRWNRIGDRR